MKNYIGTKEVKARPMTSKEAIEKGYKVNNHTGDGYEVEYQDGYKSWSPKEVFEEGRLQSHFEVKDKTISKEEFDIVVQVMGLLRCGKISTLTPNCDVREILLAEKIEQ